jgi:hypothetical protein
MSVLFFQSRSIREFDRHATCVVAKYEVLFLILDFLLSGYLKQSKYS